VLTGLDASTGKATVDTAHGRGAGSLPPLAAAWHSRDQKDGVYLSSKVVDLSSGRGPLGHAQSTQTTVPPVGCGRRRGVLFAGGAGGDANSSLTSY